MAIGVASGAGGGDWNTLDTNEIFPGLMQSAIMGIIYSAFVIL